MDWFKKQSNLVKFILLILPVVGWFVEVYIRWTQVMKNASVLNIIVAIVYTFAGWAWILGAIDAVLSLLGKDVLFAD